MEMERVWGRAGVFQVLKLYMHAMLHLSRSHLRFVEFIRSLNSSSRSNGIGSFF